MPDNWRFHFELTGRLVAGKPLVWYGMNYRLEDAEKVVRRYRNRDEIVLFRDKKWGLGSSQPTRIKASDVARMRIARTPTDVFLTTEPKDVFADEEIVKELGDFVDDKRPWPPADPVPRGPASSPPEDATSRAAAKPTPSSPASAVRRVFIGHGRSSQWRELKDFLAERLGLPWDEFNRVPTAGVPTPQRLSQMLDDAGIAFIVLTAEDETGEGKTRARQNVVHEVGLFQGRLGFERAIVLLEEGCEEFSNIAGLGQIRFPRGKIRACFEDVREVLEREGFVDGR